MKTLLASQRFLAVYSGVLTLVFVVSVLAALGAKERMTTFDTITVHRINVVEPDGTLRMTISNKTQFPGIIIKGQEHPHPNRTTAGILFFNDEGTENGGLIFGGAKDKNGQVSSYGHLSFDPYEQDQVLSLESTQEGAKQRSGLSLVDEPDYPITDLVALSDRIRKLPPQARQAAMNKFWETHARPQQRAYLGRNPDHSVTLRLKDQQGRDRLVMEVTADGTPGIRLLDEKGKTVAHLP